MTTHFEEIDGQQASAASAAEPEEQTMESLLNEQSEYQDKLKSREVVWVKIVQIGKEQILVDIGEKSEAVIPASEFPEGQAPEPGRRIPAVLVSRGRGDHPTMMSTEKARWRMGWDVVAKAFEEKVRVKGKVTSAIRGGFLVDVNGVTGFMPASQSDLRPVRKPDAMVGTGVRCYVIELNKDKSQVILSRRAVLEEDSRQRREKLLSDLKVGSVRIGRVMRVNEHGVFIDIGGIDGLVRNEDVAWKEPEQAKGKLSRGQKLRVRVLKIDQDEAKVVLGFKQLTPHPADALRRRYPVKSVVTGKVSEILKEGVRIKLSRGDTAYCPARELQVEGGDPTQGRADRRVELPPLWPAEGESVSGIVTGIQQATFEVSVSIRRYESIQERKRVARYLKGSPPLTLGDLLNPEGG
ncbi:MAG: S1 RNA-binding domain-containing protein [Elusimicrobiota bacterium]